MYAWLGAEEGPFAVNGFGVPGMVVVVGNTEEKVVLLGIFSKNMNGGIDFSLKISFIRC